MNEIIVSERGRLAAVDWLRGFVMVLMALDHTRGIFHHYGFNVADPEKTVSPLFVSRVVTHACAPTFLFLAGASVYLAMKRGRTRAEMARDYFIRGLWMIFLEFTVVHLGFEGEWSWKSAGAGVFFALGGSMISLSLLLWLPNWAIGILGIAVIGGHNALDGWHAESWGDFQPVWQILHENTLTLHPFEGAEWKFRWPIIPWFGIMAAGLGYGPLLLADRLNRRRITALLGVAAIIGFFVIRWANVYGDTHPWRSFEEPSRTILSFFHVEKYGPSLLYVLMTLGPILCLFAWIDRPNPPLPFLTVFGRTPLFFYLLHLPLIQVLAKVSAPIRNHWLPDRIWSSGLATHSFEHHLYLLAWAYMGTAACVAILYPVCVWYDGYKSRHRNNWLLYYL